MMQEKAARAEVVEKYKKDVERLSSYLPWLIEKNGETASHEYEPEGGGTIRFPVYDAMLLRFVKDVEQSVFYDRNYPYVYSRNRLRTPADELRLISQADIMNMGQIGGILSRYVISGKTRGVMWSEGLKEGIYLAALQKAKELIDYYAKDALSADKKL